MVPNQSPLQLKISNLKPLRFQILRKIPGKLRNSFQFLENIFLAGWTVLFLTIFRDNLSPIGWDGYSFSFCLWRNHLYCHLLFKCLFIRFGTESPLTSFDVLFLKKLFKVKPRVLVSSQDLKSVKNENFLEMSSKIFSDILCRAFMAFFRAINHVATF